MYGFRDGSSPRARRACRSGMLRRKVVSLLTVVGTTALGAACSGAASSTQTKVPLVPLAPSPELESSYVAMVETGLDELPALADSVAMSAPSAEPIAAAYARRYDIPHDLALDITQHALEAGLDPELAFRLVRVESVFKVSARGRQGALGLTQLMPGTARSLDRSLDTEREILDRDNNLRIGFRYLREMIDRYDDVRLGLLAYNRGQTSVDRALRRGADPENGYSHKVLGTRGSRPYNGTGLAEAPGE